MMIGKQCQAKKNGFDVTFRDTIPKNNHSPLSLVAFSGVGLP
jgi:hypothetical protein